MTWGNSKGGRGLRMLRCSLEAMQVSDKNTLHISFKIDVAAVKLSCNQDLEATGTGWRRPEFTIQLDNVIMLP